MSKPQALRSRAGQGLMPFALLALGISWALQLPFALALLAKSAPADYAPPLLALSAFGPTIAAFLVAGALGALPAVFGRWRVNPLWVAVGLLTPLLVHLPATLGFVALGGAPSHWFYPPIGGEAIAALVIFSVGEEFGWRGFAYPRLTERWGPVAGSLSLGLLWALWHLLLSVSPESASLDVPRFALAFVELPLLSLVFASIFERGGRSMAVALALHIGLHLDNTARAPLDEHGLWALRLLVLLAAAAFAARSLRRRRSTRESEARPDAPA